MLVALVFVLARNIIKLIVERRRALPFARFRAKLVAVLLGMTLVPAVLVLHRRQRADSQRASIAGSTRRWTRSCRRPTRSPSDYYHERQLLRRAITRSASRARWPASIWRSADVRRVRDLIAPDVTLRARADGRGATACAPCRRPLPQARAGRRRRRRRRCRRATSRASADRLAAQALAGAAETALARAARRRRRPAARGRRHARAGRPASAGVVVATDYLTGDLAARSRRMTQAFEDYSQLRVLKRPLTGVYLSFFLMVTLMILVGATWMGLYLAKRITRPVQMLAAAAREIGAGHLDQRVEPESNDEFGSLVEAFNTMAGELAASRRKVERSTIELERKHVEVEGRRRYIETILERITTGVVSVDARGRDHARSTARRRGCSASTPTSSASRRRRCSRAPDLQPLAALLAGAAAAAREPPAQEIAITRDGHELHLAAVATRARRRQRRARRRRAGVRRRDAADPRAEGRGVARSGAPARARDQEPADADSAVGRAAAPPFRPAPPADAGAGRRVHDDDRRRGRVAEGAGRRVLAVRAHAGAAHRADRPARSCSTTRSRSTTGSSPTCAFEQRFAAGAAARAARPRADPARHHQPGRQRHRSDGAARARSSSRRSTIAANSVVADRRRRRRPGFRPASATSCSCRTTRPSGAAAASASRSSAASSPSTAAASTSATTRRAAPGLRSSCRADDG